MAISRAVGWSMGRGGGVVVCECASTHGHASSHHRDVLGNSSPQITNDY